MRRTFVLIAVLGMTFVGMTVMGLAPMGTALARFAGPGPGVTGNDTGGIIPYSPDVEGIYRDIAARTARAGAGCRR